MAEKDLNKEIKEEIKEEIKVADTGMADILKMMEEMQAGMVALKAENASMQEDLKKAEKAALGVEKEVKKANAEKELSQGQKRALMEKKIHEAMEDAKKDVVSIKIPRTKTEKEDVFVSVNGYSYLIKRGEGVEVPRFVADVLKNSEAQEMAAMEFMEGLEKME